MIRHMVIWRLIFAEKGSKTTMTAAAALRAFAVVLKDPDNSTSKVWVPFLAPTLKGYDF